MPIPLPDVKSVVWRFAMLVATEYLAAVAAVVVADCIDELLHSLSVLHSLNVDWMAAVVDIPYRSMVNWRHHPRHDD